MKSPLNAKPWYPPGPLGQNTNLLTTPGTVTDHRINHTMYNLSAVMDGDIQEFIDKLQMEENTQRLKEAGM
jgi:hypothetical protein